MTGAHQMTGKQREACAPVAVDDHTLRVAFVQTGAAAARRADLHNHLEPVDVPHIIPVMASPPVAWAHERPVIQQLRSVVGRRSLEPIDRPRRHGTRDLGK